MDGINFGRDFSRVTFASVINFAPTITLARFFPKGRGSFFSTEGKKGAFLWRKITGTRRSNVARNEYPRHVCTAR